MSRITQARKLERELMRKVTPFEREVRNQFYSVNRQMRDQRFIESHIPQKSTIPSTRHMTRENGEVHVF